MRPLVYAAMLCLATQTILHAEVIELVNADRLNVTVLARDDQHLTVQHPVLGEITLPLAQIAAILPSPPPPPPEVSQHPEDSQPPESACGLAPPPPPPPPEVPPEVPPEMTAKTTAPPPAWKRRFEAGLDGSDGNNQTLNFRAAFTGDYEDTQDRWHLGSAFVRQTTDGDKTRNDFFAEAVRDWLEPGRKHFYFGQARYDYDDFQAWRQRAALGGGGGYPLIEQDRLGLIGRLGGGGNYAWGGESDDQFTPEALLGVEGFWQIRDGQKFEFKNTLYPSLGDAGEFRNLTSLAYVISLDQVKGLSLKLGLENEYESDIDDQSKHNDLKYFAAMVFEF